MSFFSRVLNHILNEVLVNGLANSRVFQRFAIRTNENLKEAVKKGVDVKQKAWEFSTAFRKELNTQIKESTKDSAGKKDWMKQ